MITSETLRVTSGDVDQMLHLAPYGFEEVAKFIPMDLNDIPYEPVATQQDRFASAPARVLAGIDDHAHARSWGIYDGKPSYETFVGMVDLYEQAYGDVKNPQYTRATQEIGTTVFSPDFRGRGIGTLAKLAVIRYALEVDNTHGFTAETSEHNLAAHKSLIKTGFAHTDTYQRYIFPGGERTLYWMLGDQQVQEALRGDNMFTPSQKQAIEEGWQRYEQASKRMVVEAL